MIKVPPSTEIDETLRYIIITVNTRQIVQKNDGNKVYFYYNNVLRALSVFEPFAADGLLFRNGHSLSQL